MAAKKEVILSRIPDQPSEESNVIPFPKPRSGMKYEKYRDYTFETLVGVTGAVGLAGLYGAYRLGRSLLPILRK